MHLSILTPGWLTAVCPGGWPCACRSSQRLDPGGSAPRLNLRRCRTMFEPSGLIMKWKKPTRRVFICLDSVAQIYSYPEKNPLALRRKYFYDGEKHFVVWLLYLQLRGGPRCVRQVADLRAVPPQAAVNTAALITYQHTSVHRGPARLWWGGQRSPTENKSALNLRGDRICVIWRSFHTGKTISRVDTYWS